VQRLVSAVPVLAVLGLLAAHRPGRRHPGLPTHLALAVVQVDVARMCVRVRAPALPAG